MSISPNPHNIEVQETSPDEVWESIEQAAAETEAEGTEDFFAEVEGDPKPAARTRELMEAMEQSVNSQNSANASTVESVPPSTPADNAIGSHEIPADPVPGVGDWMVDPETGEVVERPAILKKLGWTEFPTLPENPSSQDLEAFELKLDQIVDRITSHQLEIEKLTKQLEKRIAPRHKAMGWWLKFLEPLAIQLAEKRLPRYKSGQKAGQFSKKTLHLESGSVEFEKGGGYSLFDYSEFKAYVEKEGIEKFKEYGAEKVVSMNYPKLAAAVRAGKFKDAPGVKHEEEKPLAKVKVSAPDLSKKG
jgi:hypothetical protein